MTAQRTMKRGKQVMIYQKPITREQPEGSAILKRLHSIAVCSTEYQLEIWSVNFVGDDDILRRAIRVDLK